VRARRAPFLLLAVASLAAGIGGGLARVELWLPGVPDRAAALHGPLMVVGFLATLIGVERAAALGRPWGWSAPALSGLGGVALAAGAPPGPALLAAGSLALAAVLAAGTARHRTPWLAVQAIGAALLVLGTALFAADGGAPRAVQPWAAFLVLTVVAERRELSRVAEPPAWARRAFAALAAAAAVAAAASVALPDAGVRAAGAAWLGLALWLARFDLARRSVRRPGLPRYMGAALLAGMAWLALAGVLALAGGLPPAGPWRDAVLHALFVGFVFSMVFGHAPVIFPAVLGVRIEFRRRFWAHLALLHAGLVLRVAGDLAEGEVLRAGGAFLNALAILLFFASTAAAVRRPAAARAET
jgi:hypothetical protein